MRCPLICRSSGGPSKPEQVGAQHEIHADAARHRDGAHQEFGGEAMPEPEAVFGDRGSEDRTHGRVKDRSYGIGRSDADNEACQDEKLGRKAHQERRLMRRARQVCRRGAEENVANEAKRIGDREHAGQQ